LGEHQQTAYQNFASARPVKTVWHWPLYLLFHLALMPVLSHFFEWPNRAVGGPFSRFEVSGIGPLISGFNADFTLFFS